ncbi:MAG: hypothetical protein LBG16_01460 [Elusimicrobiota bacterium]|jgi:hypothetical protein|nr:hypothetical protein [Elusimicrobiota bacterium]
MNAKKILKFSFIFAFAAVPARIAAQTMKYVTYFPVPHAYYKTLNVKETALLATRGMPAYKLEDVFSENKPYISGEVFIGNNDNKTGDLTVNGSFNPYNNLTILAFGTGKGYESNIGGLTVLGNNNNPSPAVGILGIVGDVTIKQGSTFNATGLIAYNKLIIKKLLWDGISGELDVSGCSKGLSWQTLQLSGTDAYRTYLVCGQ